MIGIKQVVDRHQLVTTEPIAKDLGGLGLPVRTAELSLVDLCMKNLSLIWQVSVDFINFFLQEFQLILAPCQSQLKALPD